LQRVASARGAGGPPGLLAAELGDGVDPLAVGADLVVWLGQVCRGQGMVLAVIDDLQWADGPSARAVLFAVRRLQAEQVLVVVSARPGELSRLGEGWQRFLTGDHRARRVRLGGLGPEDVVALGRALGAGELPRRAIGRLLEDTGGNPLYCRAVLEEVGVEGLDWPGGALRVPRSLAGAVLLRLGSLSPAARELVAAAAVLGHHCELAAAAALASLGELAVSDRPGVTGASCHRGCAWPRIALFPGARWKSHTEPSLRAKALASPGPCRVASVQECNLAPPGPEQG
jgi:hypothetical protein